MAKLLIVIAMLIGCSSSPKQTPPPPPTGGSGNADTACTTNDDCIAIEVECCDHCNGGKAEAYNKAHADAHQRKEPCGTACTELACGKAVATCDAGTCKVSIAPL